MFSFNEQLHLDEGKYFLQIETDSRPNFELVRELLRAIVDNKVCSVTVSTDSGNITSGYICAGVDNNE